MKKSRCGWCGNQPIYQAYHDEEWGSPNTDEKGCFEIFMLETLQAGLSWWTVLSKREDYRKALCDFDAEKIAHFDENDYERLMNTDNLIKNRLKMRALIHNAQIYRQFCEKHGGFAKWFWGKVNNRPLHNQFKTMKDIPATTMLSDEISKELKKFGFKFFGSTTCYAYMQAIGIVNDHVEDCFLYTSEKPTSVTFLS